EGGLVADARHDIEAEHADVEVERAVDVGHLEVDVADVHAGVERCHCLGAYPCVCLISDSFCCAWARVSPPPQTSALSSFSVWSICAARGYGSGQRLRGSFGLPPSSRLMR